MAKQHPSASPCASSVPRGRWRSGLRVACGLAGAMLIGLPSLAAPRAVPDFVLSPAAAASPSPWQVSGRVRFQQTGKPGLPALGIEVFLTNAGGQVVDRGRTDASGQYLLTAPGPGTYEVRVDQSSATRRRGALLAPFKQVITLH